MILVFVLSEKKNDHEIFSDMVLTLSKYQNRAPLIAELVKNPPEMQETLVWFLGGLENPLEKG